MDELRAFLNNTVQTAMSTTVQKNILSNSESKDSINLTSLGLEKPHLLVTKDMSHPNPLNTSQQQP